MNVKGFERANLKTKERALNSVGNNSPLINSCDVFTDQIEQQTLVNPSASNEEIISYKFSAHRFFSAKNNMPKLTPVLLPPKIIKKLTTLPVINPQKKIPLHPVIVKPINESERNKIITMQKCLRKKKLKIARAYKREQFKACKERLKKHRYYLYYLNVIPRKINPEHNNSEKKVNPYHFFVSAQNYSSNTWISRYTAYNTDIVNIINL